MGRDASVTSAVPRRGIVAVLVAMLVATAVPLTPAGQSDTLPLPDVVSPSVTAVQAAARVVSDGLARSVAAASHTLHGAAAGIAAAADALGHSTAAGVAAAADFVEGLVDLPTRLEPSNHSDPRRRRQARGPGGRAALATTGALGALALNASSVAAAPGPIDPAAVSFVAGNGTNATADGTAALASFRDMNAVVVAGGVVYVGSVGSIRKVVPSTGVVTTLAGHATATGCIDSTVATSVRFGTVRSLATDGTNLYSLSDCGGLRKTVMSSGATSTLATIAGANYVTYAAGSLYVTSGTSVLKVATKNGAATTFAALGATGHVLVADTTYLWVATSGTTPSLKRVALSGAAVTTTANVADLSLTGLASHATHLYAADSSGRTLRSYDKADGTVRSVAGTGLAGYAEGTGTDAWLNGVRALASDGTALWLADSSNYRLRKAVDAAPLPSAQQAPATTTLAITAGAVTTVAGNNGSTTVDGTGAAASFASPGGVAVLNGFAYVGTNGTIRKVNLATNQVTTLAGHATATGCTDAATGSTARFMGVADVVTDGYYLYTASCWSIRRTSLANGATSTVAPIGVGRLTVGGDGKLYGTVGNEVVRVDPATGASTTLTRFVGADGIAITADASWLWVVTLNGYGQNELVRMSPVDGTSVVVVPISTTRITTGCRLGRGLPLCLGRDQGRAAVPQVRRCCRGHRRQRHGRLGRRQRARCLVLERHGPRLGRDSALGHGRRPQPPLPAHRDRDAALGTAAS